MAASAEAAPMTLATAFWIASCSKAVTGIACMQLVETGVLRLDDGAQLEGLLPELRALKVLRADRALEDKRVAVTLRMLLTHTAGFGYSFSVERLRDWNYPAGSDEFNGRVEEIMQPLLFQPGEGWEYSVCLPMPPCIVRLGCVQADCGSSSASTGPALRWSASLA